MVPPEVYWIWLQQALDVACKALSRLLEFFSSARAFYEEGIDGWRSLGFFTEAQLQRLENTPISAAEAVYREALELGYDLVTPEQDRYPHTLRQLIDPPAVLYCKGKLPDFDHLIAVAVVGTRTASPYGRKIAYEISVDLCRAGVVVVSGGALGVDIAAHKGALSVNGVTVAVLGCGINYPYLMENAGIRSAMTVRGAVITEYPPSAPPLPYHFPVRNRLISGLSQGTLVVEAAHKSGSLITASRALEQGKDIFAIPGNIAATTSRGTNELIQSGAKAVLSAEDILEEYRLVYPGRVASSRFRRPDYTDQKKNIQREGKAAGKKAEARKPNCGTLINVEGLSNYARALYCVLTTAPQHLDDLTEAAGLTPSQGLCAVTELELLGCLCTQSGKRYSLNRV